MDNDRSSPLITNIRFSLSIIIIRLFGVGMPNNNRPNAPTKPRVPPIALRMLFVIAPVGVMDAENDFCVDRINAPAGVMAPPTTCKKKPATFAVNRVIKGWSEGLQLMKQKGFQLVVC